MGRGKDSKSLPFATFSSAGSVKWQTVRKITYRVMLNVPALLVKSRPDKHLAGMLTQGHYEPQ